VYLRAAAQLPEESFDPNTCGGEQLYFPDTGRRLLAEHQKQMIDRARSYIQQERESAQTTS